MIPDSGKSKKNLLMAIAPSEMKKKHAPINTCQNEAELHFLNRSRAVATILTITMM